MAQIYPRQPDIEPDHPERFVFDSLRDGLPDDWIVVYGRRFVLPRQRGRTVEGEVDFLVLDPNRGMVGLEVKGGVVGRDPDGWYRLVHDRERRPIRDPGAQSQNGIHQLARFLRAADPALSDLSYGWGVVFPDVDANGGYGPDLPRRLVVDRGGLRDPEPAVSGVLDHFNLTGPGLGEREVEAFTRSVLPRFQLVPSLKPASLRLEHRVAVDEEELVRLTEAQMRILDFSGHATRLAVEGGAGTGKTLVALEQARRLQAQGQRVLLLCYNKALAEGLADQVRDIDDLDIYSFHRLCHDKSRAAGLGFYPPREDATEFWDSTCAELLLSALEQTPDYRYDAVIVDEGQDFADLWWVAVETLLRDPETGTLWVFHDPAQNIFERESWDELDRMQSVRLPENCRNTKHIGTHAYGILDQEPTFLPGAPDGTVVAETVCADERAMVDEVRKALHHLIVEEGLTSDRVVVLSARAEYASPVWRQRTFGNYELAPFPATEPNQVGFATLQRFKGLEADAVVLCELMPGEPHSTPNHVYVGASRAKHALISLAFVQA